MSALSDFDFGFDPDAPDELEIDRQIDLWHEGYFMHRDRKPRPTDCQFKADGWDHRARDCQVQVVEVVRPEGYYHMPLGTFD